MSTTTTTASSTPLPFQKSISHITSYPVISSTISHIQSLPIAQTAQSYTTSASKILSPLNPLLQKASELSEPLFTKADDLANSGLGKVDERWPIVRESPEAIFQRVEEGLKISEVRKMKQTVIELGHKEKEYILSVWEKELEKNGNEKRYMPLTKATISTGYVLSAELLNWISAFITSGREQDTSEETCASGEKQAANSPQSERNTFPVDKPKA